MQRPKRRDDVQGLRIFFLWTQPGLGHPSRGSQRSPTDGQPGRLATGRHQFTAAAASKHSPSGRIFPEGPADTTSAAAADGTASKTSKPDPCERCGRRHAIGRQSSEVCAFPHTHGVSCVSVWKSVRLPNQPKYFVDFTVFGEVNADSGLEAGPLCALSPEQCRGDHTLLQSLRCSPRSSRILCGGHAHSR